MLYSNASLISNEGVNEAPETVAVASTILAYKVAMLGETGVGKTALTYQFTTSDYICAYDLSLGKLNVFSMMTVSCWLI